MRGRSTIMVTALALIGLGASQIPAQAIGVLMLVDRLIKKEAHKALNTPGHVAWCAKKHPGFRPKWNNYRIAGGRVKYCASPYYSPPWMK